MTAWLLPLFTSVLSLLMGYDEANLVFVGDAMQHQAQINASKRDDGSYDYSQYFTAIKPIVSLADYAVVNLETPAGPPPHTGYPAFNAPAEFVDALADAGFDMFLTANNHTLDRGPKGLRRTIGVLDERSLDHIGTYCDDSARTTALPMIRKVNGFAIGFLNYTYGTNGIEPRDGVCVDYIDRKKIKSDIEQAREAGAELVCVCIHWGDEYKMLPVKSETDMADFLESCGTDMIIGSHPHVIQPVEFRPNRYFPDKNVLVVYSLGNFVSNMTRRDTRGGLMMHVKLARGEDRIPVVKDASYRLVFTVPGTSPDNNFRVEEADSVKTGPMAPAAGEFAKSARAVLDGHNIGVKKTGSKL